MEGFTKEAIARMLKDARIQNKMSVEEVAAALKAYGLDIAPKSVYNYETGINMPQVPMFIAMCKVYGIEDPLASLRNGVVKKVEVTAREEYLLNCFRKASPEMQDAALRVLEPVEKENTASQAG